MIKKETQQPILIDSDSAPGIRKENTALDILNMEVDNNDRLGSLSNIRNTQDFSSSPLKNIVGYTEIEEYMFFMCLMHSSLFLFCIDASGTKTQLLVTNWDSEETENIELDVIANRENENILKLYWCGGGLTQINSINVYDSSAFSESGTISPCCRYVADNLKTVALVEPRITDKLEGGNLPAGKRQYAYNLFNLGGAASKLSPLSDLVSVAMNGLGGESEEKLNISIKVSMYLGETNYSYIRVYSIHYYALDQTPEITLIKEIPLVSVTHVIDDGNLSISTLSVDEFKNLGGTVLSPNTISIKNNRMFAGNYKSTSFDVPQILGDYNNINTDCRVYPFIAAGTAYVDDTIQGQTVLTRDSLLYHTVPVDSDCIAYSSLYPDGHYTADGAKKGATGRNFELVFVRRSLGSKLNVKSLKQGETYRIGVVYYDKFSRISPVYYMVDLLVPRYHNFDASVAVTLAFVGNPDHFSDLGVVSFQLVIAERLPRDRTISSQGIINPGAEYYKALDGTNYTYPEAYTKNNYHNQIYLSEKSIEGIVPYYTLKTIVSDIYEYGGDREKQVGGMIQNNYVDSVDMAPLRHGREMLGSVPVAELGTVPIKRDNIQFFTSSDTIFDFENVQEYTHVEIHNVLTTTNYKGQRTRIRLYVNGTLIDSTVYAGIQYTDSTIKYLFYHMPESGGPYNAEYTFLYNFTEIINAATPTSIKLKNSIALKANETGKLTQDTIQNFAEIPMMTYVPGYGTSGYSANMVNSQVLEFDSEDWHLVHTQGEKPYDRFISSKDISTKKRALPIVELSRVLQNQYGGNTYEDKKKSTYLLKGKIVKLIGYETTTNYIGDVTLGPLNINTHDGLDSRTANYTNIYTYIQTTNLEHNVDINSRYDRTKDIGASSGDTNIGAYRLDDNHKLLSAYNQKKNLITVTGKPVTFRDVNTFSDNIIASKVKYPNEVIDSWTEFLVNDYMSLESAGGITKLYNFNNEIFSFQKNTIAQIKIEPQTQLQTSSDIGVELGTGSVLYNFKVITNNSGTLSKNSITDDGKLLVYYDSKTNSINTLDGTELSTNSRIQKLMNIYKPINISSLRFTYVHSRHEFVFGLNTTNLIYNTLLGGFQRREDGGDYPITFMSELFYYYNGVRPLIKAYSGEIADILLYKEGMLELLFTPEFKKDKVFSFLEYRAKNNLTLTKLSVTGSDSSNTGELEEPNLDIKSKFSIKRVKLPRISNSTGRRPFRVRDIFIKTKLYFKKEAVDNEKGYIDDITIMYNTKD